MASRHHGAMEPRHHGTSHYGTKEPRTMAPRHHTPWHQGTVNHTPHTMAPRTMDGAMAPCPMEPRNHGTMAPRQRAPWRHYTKELCAWHLRARVPTASTPRHYRHGEGAMASCKNQRSINLGKAPEGNVSSSSPIRHAMTCSYHRSSSSSSPTTDEFRTGTPMPSPQSQSFSQSYGSNWPTILAYIIPLKRGCSPWRPNAVMSAIEHRRYSILNIFKGYKERTEHHAMCGSLPVARSYI
ncbi:hypothetical protein BC332_23803 [Capsicum chinense]|nr:hypothetical protein BC332_23803 [Capsicum chinense]